MLALFDCVYLFCNRENSGANVKVRVGSPNYNRGGLLVSVRRRIVHEYRTGYGKSGLDFGLLQLRRNLVFSDTINAIKLSDNGVIDNEVGLVTGWGVRVSNEVNTFQNIIVT